MKKIILALCVSLLFAEGGVILTIDDHKFSLYDFYSRYPKKQWQHADSLQKDKMFAEFIRREICVLEAKKQGFENDPSSAIKIRNRSEQILVNESYEQFVALPLIPSSELRVARKYAKRDIFVHHILIGYSGAYLGRPPQRTLDEAFVLSQQIKKQFEGDNGFKVLAEKYSDDPSVEKNSGSLGWVRWGETVHEFQLAAFALKVGVISAPVLTDFGYHLIVVSEERPSDYQHLDEDSYENLILNITKNSIRDRLRPAAIKYDSLKIEGAGVLFNLGAVKKIIKKYNILQKENSLGKLGGDDFVTFLESVGGIGVVCVYFGKGYGSKWFARYLARLSSSRRPSFDSEEEIISVFKTIILQKIAVNDGLAAGVPSLFSYKQRQTEMISTLLYDVYLKHLVNSSSGPDSAAVANYYDKNKLLDYMGPENVIVREIRVSKRDVADSLLLVLDGGFDFSLLAQQYSFTNPDKGGVMEPFSKNQNSSFFNATLLLDVGEISPVLPSVGNSFSIIQLVERVDVVPLKLDKVYAQIESLLIKKNQDAAKLDGIDALFEIYVIHKNISLLN